MMFHSRLWRRAAVAVAASSLLLVAGCSPAEDTNGGAPPAAPPAAENGEETGTGSEELLAEFPRGETIFTSGQAWGPPSSWNPVPGQFGATGTTGLLYETLMVFDPVAGEMKPWLAESGEWTSDNTFEITLREGITWHDGETLDSADVVFSFEIGQRPGVGWGTDLWQQLESVEATDELHVVFTFSDPRPQQWDMTLNTRTIVPEHIFGDWSDEALMTSANENPVGSGAFRYHSHGQDRMVWERNDDWWGLDALGLDFAMRFIVDIVNPSNEVALGMLTQGQLDLSNNFLPGIRQLVDGGQVITYIRDEPFMLGSNVAMLIPNAETAPGNDPAFRRALAHSIDVDQIIASAFGGIVEQASPTGLLPTFEEFIDQDLVNELGFTFDTDEARRIMEEAGYPLGADGYFQHLDGSPMDLELIVPAGWTDWMDAARLISESAADAGIRIHVNTPDSGAVDQQRESGQFDLVINNWSQINASPWAHWNYIFHMPILETQLIGNFGRWDATEAFSLVQALGATHTGDAEFTRIMSELQRIQMEELPMIPMWNNGLWAQMTEGTWTNWPERGTDVDFLPTTWGGYWQMGTVRMLAALEPAG